MTHKHNANDSGHTLSKPLTSGHLLVRHCPPLCGWIKNVHPCAFFPDVGHYFMVASASPHLVLLLSAWAFRFNF